MNKPSKKTFFAAVAMYAMLLVYPALADYNVPSQEYISKVTALAKRGDIKSESELGDIYATGQGVTQNFSEAVKWYRKAAEQGYDDAQVELSAM